MSADEREFRVYATFGKLMYEKILPLNREDNLEELNAYAFMTDALFRYEIDKEELSRFDRVTGGFMLELSEWVGIKLDAPEMADNYGQIIKESFPKIFED